jgi:hypothetical protein
MARHGCTVPCLRVSDFFASRACTARRTTTIQPPGGSERGMCFVSAGGPRPDGCPPGRVRTGLFRVAEDKPKPPPLRVRVDGARGATGSGNDAARRPPLELGSARGEREHAHGRGARAFSPLSRRRARRLRPATEEARWIVATVT